MFGFEHNEILMSLSVYGIYIVISITKWRSQTSLLYF